MKVAILGIGYVGLSIAACLSELGHKVFCYDCDKEKINSIINGKCPIFEPDLDELINKNTTLKRLFFLTDIKHVIKDTDICFICVGTPNNKKGEADTTQVDNAVDLIAKNINKYCVIINKSTVPVGSTKYYREKILKKTNTEFDIVSNPEFLRQGNAIKDFLHPERIVIGTSSKKARERMLELYKPLNLDEKKIILTDENSAEMIKYSANSFLALKISFINEIANLCEKTGANIEDVKKGVSLDSRIGDKFLNAGIGFGGSCFPKDINSIINIAKKNNVSLKTIQAAKEVNLAQKEIFFKKILNFYKGNIKGKTFTIWGLSFKPKTNDLRHAPSLYLIKKLVKKGAKIKAYDPKAKFSHKNFEQKNNQFEALENSNALILVSEWEEFKNPDFFFLSRSLKDKVIFDARNQYINRNLKEYGLQYFCVGKNEQ